MNDGPAKGDRPFLERWSQRKLAVARERAQAADATKAASQALPVSQPAAASQSPAASQPAVVPSTPVASRAETAPVQPVPAPELPPVDALTFDSDFTAFLAPGVDASLRSQALRKLFSDPRFNVMDGLDVYIDDYTKFEPMTPDIVAQLNHAKFLFDPPKTRINAQGHAEDVPVAPPSRESSAEDGESEIVEAQPPAQLVDETNAMRVDDALPVETPAELADVHVRRSTTHDV